MSNRAYAEEEERGRQRHAARQDRLRGGATSIEIRETFGRATGRIVRRAPLAIALGIGAVYLGRIGFTGILDNIGDLGVVFLASLAGAAGAIVSGTIALGLAASVIRLVVRAARNALRAAADEHGLTIVTDIAGDLPPGGGPARFAWGEVKSLARYVTYGWDEAEESRSSPPSPEYLVVTTHDDRMVRTLVDGPRKPWRRLMLIARDVGRVADVSGIDNAGSHYTDTDPFRLRFGK
ncbi:hypothetical protein [Frankia sp. CiP1_Cm_nod2]|uniref:hypothetical protein n=1 Tax=Frankia sp. CiP1_Cm_nod2 TaxID=2897161 RepID=UPI0020253A8A